MTPAEKRLADAKVAKQEAEILCKAVWKETERQRNKALYAYDVISMKYEAARHAYLAEESS